MCSVCAYCLGDTVPNDQSTACVALTCDAGQGLVPAGSDNPFGAYCEPCDTTYGGYSPGGSSSTSFFSPNDFGLSKQQQLKAPLNLVQAACNALLRMPTVSTTQPTMRARVVFRLTVLPVKELSQTANASAIRKSTEFVRDPKPVMRTATPVRTTPSLAEEAKVSPHQLA